jgi:hypothetical protein
MAIDDEIFRAWLDQEYEKMLAVTVQCIRNFKRAELMLGHALGDLLVVSDLRNRIFCRSGRLFIATQRDSQLFEYPLERYVIRRACGDLNEYFDRQKGQSRMSPISTFPKGIDKADTHGDQPQDDECVELAKGLSILQSCLQKLRSSNNDQYCAVIHCLVCGGDLEHDCPEVVELYVSLEELDTWRKRSKVARKTDCSRGRSAIRRCLIDMGFRFREMNRRLPPCCPSKITN